MKYGLILSGGGFKGAIQLGAVSTLMTDQYNGKGELVHKAIKWDAIRGISVGALIGSLLAQDDLPTLVKLWQSVKDSQGGVITDGKLGEIRDGKLKLNFERILDAVGKGVNFWDVTRGIFGKRGKQNIIKEVADNVNAVDSILDNSPLRRLLQQTLDLSKVIVDYGGESVSLETGLKVKWHSNDFFDNFNYAEAVLSSSTMPVIWKPVDVIRSRKGTNNFVVDGGVRSSSPSGALFDIMQENEEWTLVFINCNPRILPSMIDKRWNITNTMGRTIDMMLNQNFVTDMDTAIWLNDNAPYLNMNPNRTKKIKQADRIIIIEPKIGDGGETLDARPEIIDYRIELGKQLALEALGLKNVA